MPITQNTNAFAWTQAPVMHATRMFFRLKTNGVGESNKCWWIRRRITTGSQNLKWTWRSLTPRANPNFSCGK